MTMNLQKYQNNVVRCVQVKNVHRGKGGWGSRMLMYGVQVRCEGVG